MAAPASSTEQSPYQREEKEDLLDAIAPFVAEFVGTFILVLTIGLTGQFSDPEWSPLAVGFTLMTLIYNFGNVSGANVNPAVSFSLALSGKISWSRAFKYILVQVGAGIVAGLLLGAFAWDPVTKHHAPGYKKFHGAFCEVIFTTLLCLVVLCCATAKKSVFPEDSNHYFGLAIGLAVAGGAYVSSKVSGRVTFNPAAAIGLDFGFSIYGDDWYGSGWVLSLLEILGAFLAAMIFRVIHAEDFGEGPEYEHPRVLEYVPRLSALTLSEFVGTFILTFTIVLGTIEHAPMTMVGGAAVYASLVYALMNVSGAHCNPAVTLAVVFSWRQLITPRLGLIYAVVQLAAGCCGGLMAGAIHQTTDHESPTEILWPRQGYNWWGVAVCEGFFTMLVAYGMLTVATTESIHKYSSTAHSFPHGLAIGFMLLTGSIATKHISGGMFNPAVSFGLGMDNSLADGWMYPCLYTSLFQLAGGAVAAVLELITHGTTMHKRRKEREEPRQQPQSS